MLSSPLDHEQVVMRRDPQTGLVAIFAIHSTALGPGAGGCRRWRYMHTDAALEDVLRLSEGMSYKNALADIPFGGAKSVILADHQAQPSAAQLAVFGRWLNELQGQYITAEDVGMGTAPMIELARHSPYVSGVGVDGIGGNPSPKTAYGVFLGLKTAVQHHLQRQHLYGVSVAVQGLGSVGMTLCHWLARAGADLIVADVDPAKVNLAMRKYDARAVAVQDIVASRADVFAPCALGGVITEQVAAELPVHIVAGAANNQLSGVASGEILHERGILYAPDFVINAGGVISVAHEYLRAQGQFGQGDDAQQWVSQRIEGIRGRLLEIVVQAGQTRRSTAAVALQMARERLAGDGGGVTADHAAA